MVISVSHDLPLSRPSLKSLVSSLAVVILFTLTVRWSAIVSAPLALSDDPDAYTKIATVWSSTGVYGTVKEPSNELQLDSPISVYADSSSPNALDSSSDIRLATTPTAFRPPLYPLIIKSLAIDSKHRFIKANLLWIHIWLGVITTTCSAICFYILLPYVSDLTKGYHIAGMVVCGSIVAADPILLRQSQLVMTETLATALTTITLLIFLLRLLDKNRHRFINALFWGSAIGILFGVNSLCRPTSLAWLLIFVVFESVWAIYRCAIHSRSFLRSEATFVFALILACFLTLTPWAFRNSQQLGKWQWTTTHGGYTLLLANNNSLYDHFRDSWSRDWDESQFFADWDLQMAQTANELEADQLATRIATDVMRSRPNDFLGSIPAKLFWLWAPWPNQGSMFTKIAIGGWYVLVYAFAAVSVTLIVSKGKRKPYTLGVWLPIICLVVSISVVHSVYWSNMRMRSVAMPSLAILATVGGCVLISCSRRWRRSRAA